MTEEESRVALVTGGSSGIGRGVALRLAEAGLAVAVADKQHRSKSGQHYETDVTTPTDELIREQKDGRSVFLETDVRKESDVASTVEDTVDEFGRLDVLVNNAGILIPGTTQSL